MTLVAKSRIARLLASLILSVLLFSCSDPNQEQRQLKKISGATMGTFYNISLVGFDGDEQLLKQAVDEELARINGLMSTYDSNSEISQINKSASGQWLSISEEMVFVMSYALKVFELSGGQYDISVGPLVNLWGFGPSRGDKAPSDEEINQALARIGSDQLELDEANLKLRKKKDLYLDLSSLAKGYAVDVISSLLEKKFGVSNSLVDIGGEVKARGLNASGGPWRIGIETPSLTQNQSHTIVHLSNVSVATSGDYRNFYWDNGQRFSHIIDPKTGRPIKHQLASVTVIDESTMKADALATAFLAMGENKALAIANEKGIPVFMISHDGESLRVSQSNYFEKYLKVGESK